MSDPLIGRTLLHYHIIDKIGQGGMGGVYLAHDPRLQRNVAVKVLALSAPDERRRARFVREARAASALNHPHIVTIHDIARDGEIDFIVMEWVDGRPLSALIPRHGLPIRDAVEYGLQIADAVATAHRAGIVHRDLKPANVVVTASGRIRVLDFGLAKLTAVDDSDEDAAETRMGLTRAGTVLGTYAYMSPEQATGSAVDHRADIFSFAAMLYEMLSGARPFAGASVPAIIHALFYSEPKPLAEARPDAPAALAQTVHAALDKDLSRRTASMEMVLAELKAVASRLDVEAWTPAAPAAPPSVLTTASLAEPSRRPPATGSERASLAVLAFESLSADQEDSYLAAGITAELISALSGVPDLRVASHLASARFQGSSVDLAAAASALHIRYILTGSVRRAKNRIRVSANLTDAVPGLMLWSKTYEGGLDDIFEVQEDIARQIVSATGGELIRDGSERASRTPPENLDAWGLVRRAYHFWNHAWTPEGVEDALNLLRRAVDLDPSYAAARAFLALYLVQRTVNFISPNPGADMREALAAASTAIELAPRDPEVLANVGLVYFNTGQYEQAVAALERAVHIARFNLVAWGYLGLSHAWAGDEGMVNEGRSILDRLLRTAPDHPSVPYWLYFKTAALTRQGQFAAAADAARQSTEQQPHFFIARIAYANALGAIGQIDQARAEINRVLATNPTITPESYLQSVYLLARTDQRAANHLAGLRAAGWIAS